MLRGLQALRSRNYVLYLVGHFTSQTGAWVEQTAVSWILYELTGSAILLGLAGLARAAPTIALALVGGAVADRLPRRAAPARRARDTVARHAGRPAFRLGAPAFARRARPRSGERPLRSQPHAHHHHRQGCHRHGRAGPRLAPLRARRRRHAGDDLHGVRPAHAPHARDPLRRRHLLPAARRLRRLAVAAALGCAPFPAWHV